MNLLYCQTDHLDQNALKKSQKTGLVSIREDGTENEEIYANIDPKFSDLYFVVASDLTSVWADTNGSYRSWYKMQLKENRTGGNDEGMEEDGEDGDLYLNENTSKMIWVRFCSDDHGVSQQGTSDVQT